MYMYKIKVQAIEIHRWDSISLDISYNSQTK